MGRKPSRPHSTVVTGAAKGVDADILRRGDLAVVTGFTSHRGVGLQALMPEVPWTVRFMILYQAEKVWFQDKNTVGQLVEK